MTDGYKVKKEYIGDKQVRPALLKWLCFTAEQANSNVRLAVYTGNPTSVTLETSTDGRTWTTYPPGRGIPLSNVGDKVYIRNTSETTTGFNTSSDFYYFEMSGRIAGSGDVTTLINKNGTKTINSTSCFQYLFYNCYQLTKAPELPATTLSTYCYNRMFYGCTSLTTAPKLPATSLGWGSYYYMFHGCTSLTTAPELPATKVSGYCYDNMFRSCSNLTTLPKLPATTLSTYCYREMFHGCTKIKLSTTQTGEYQTAYRIPTTGTGADASNSMTDMFYGTGGTRKGTPSINTTYYTSTTVV